jgi:hypothetical protein
MEREWRVQFQRLLLVMKISEIASFVGISYYNKFFVLSWYSSMCAHDAEVLQTIRYADSTPTHCKMECRSSLGKYWDWLAIGATRKMISEFRKLMTVLDTVLLGRREKRRNPRAHPGRHAYSIGTRRKMWTSMDVQSVEPFRSILCWGAMSV